MLVAVNVAVKVAVKVAVNVAEHVAVKGKFLTGSKVFFSAVRVTSPIGDNRRRQERFP